VPSFISRAIVLFEGWGHFVATLRFRNSKKPRQNRVKNVSLSFLAKKKEMLKSKANSKLYPHEK